MICANCGRDWTDSEYQYGQNVCNYCWSHKSKMRATERNRSRRAAIEIQRGQPNPNTEFQQFRQQPQQNQGGCCGCIFAIAFLLGGGWIAMYLF